MKLAIKPSNPKDVIGSSKLSLGLVPDIIIAEAALAFLEGALKYGRFNWRIAGVRASVYNDAIERHRSKWWNGEDRDPVSRVKHLANLIASAGILLDAELAGMLTDDRPPRANMSKMIDDQAELVAHLKKTFADHSPKQYTIDDTPPPSPVGLPIDVVLSQPAPVVRRPIYDHAPDCYIQHRYDQSCTEAGAAFIAMTSPMVHSQHCYLPAGHLGYCPEGPAMSLDDLKPGGSE